MDADLFCRRILESDLNLEVDFGGGFLLGQIWSSWGRIILARKSKTCYSVSSLFKGRSTGTYRHVPCLSTIPAAEYLNTISTLRSLILFLYGLKCTYDST
jgi:hypothetical protein